MPTILELFKGSENDKSVKAKQETFVEQEVTGVRFRSGVELNNPAKYGSDALRIADRSTATKDKMEGNRGVDGGGDNGLIGQGLSKLTGGKVNSLSEGRDFVNSKLGIPSRQIPTSVYDRIKSAGSSWDTSKPVQGVNDGTDLGKLLKDAGGNPGTIAKQAIGKGIGFGKDKLREKLYGKEGNLKSAQGGSDGFVQQYTSQNTKSMDTIKTLETYRGLSNDADLVNLLTPSDGYELNDKGEFQYAGGRYKDLIPFYIGRYGSSKINIFRANLTGISETVSPSWNSHKFLGNPFNFYTYSGVERSVAFNLQIYAGSKAELATNWEKITELTKLTYPIQNENKLVNPPIIKFRLGDLYNTKIGYIESLSYTMPDNGTWETEENGMLLPKFIDVAMTIKFIESMTDVYSENGIYGFEKSKGAKDAINQKFQQNKITLEPISGMQSKGIRMPDITPPKVDISGMKDSLKNKVKLPQGTTSPIQASMGEIADGSAQSSLTDKLGGKSLLDGMKKLIK